MKKFVATLLTLCLAVPVSAFADPIRLGVILDTSEEIKVDYIPPEFKEEVQKAAVAGLFLTPIGGGLIAGGTAASRNKALAERLNASIGDDFDRRSILQSELTEEFAKYTDNIELVFLEPELLKKGKPDFKRIDAANTPYVVVIEEDKVGMATLKIKWGTLSPRSLIKMSVYDAKKKKRVLKEKLQGLGDPISDINAAVDTPEPFLAGYPQAVNRLAYATYWRLNGKDILHTIAKGTEHADEFVSVATVLADNAKRFTFDRPKLKGWKYRKSGTPYVFLAEPKKDRKQFAIVTDIDLLVEELGQPYEVLDDYLELRISRLEELGFDVASLQEIPDLGLSGEWTSYMIDNPNGGNSILLHRMVDNFVVSHEVIVLQEDPNVLLTKYQADIVNYIDNASLSLN